MGGRKRPSKRMRKFKTKPLGHPAQDVVDDGEENKIRESTRRAEEVAGVF
ncbi:hypothetical protein Bca52824_087216 [Brassica carinata]|uniref:Uncharacterized protein n=1 Tax=Brassica carinata TaxID=52824 RepID=A0A8X7PB91_BRACI|nr:hypothetical protein Bca52824_087216 [Brassica carinata]